MKTLVGQSLGGYKVLVHLKGCTGLDQMEKDKVHLKVDIEAVCVTGINQARQTADHSTLSLPIPLRLYTLK